MASDNTIVAMIIQKLLQHDISWIKILQFNKIIVHDSTILQKNIIH